MHPGSCSFSVHHTTTHLFEPLNQSEKWAAASEIRWALFFVTWGGLILKGVYWNHLSINLCMWAGLRFGSADELKSPFFFLILQHFYKDSWKNYKWKETETKTSEVSVTASLSLIGGEDMLRVKGQTETRKKTKPNVLKKSLKADLSSALGCRKLTGWGGGGGGLKSWEPITCCLSKHEGGGAKRKLHRCCQSMATSVWLASWAWPMTSAMPCCRHRRWIFL